MRAELAAATALSAPVPLASASTATDDLSAWSAHTTHQRAVELGTQLADTLVRLSAACDRCSAAQGRGSSQELTHCCLVQNALAASEQAHSQAEAALAQEAEAADQLRARLAAAEVEVEALSRPRARGEQTAHVRTVRRLQAMLYTQEQQLRKQAMRIGALEAALQAVAAPDA